MQFSSNLVNSLEAYKKAPKKLNYGTAGFRDKWNILHAILNRMGVLASMRSLSLNGSFVGLMITASHNEESDNGVKLVDPNGGMLDPKWEPYAEEIANANNSHEILCCLTAIIEKESIGGSVLAKVIIGRDTRPHSKELSECAIRGITGFGAEVYDLGEVTTPQLHFAVQSSNQLNSPSINIPETLETYYSTLAMGFISLLSTVSVVDTIQPVSIIIDAAGGVGALSAQHMSLAVQQLAPTTLTVEVRNAIGSIPVNQRCGAEYVQKSQQLPSGIDMIEDRDRLLCSYDGDADRIVFHSILPTPSRESEKNVYSWVLIDGDKIATLFAVFLQEELLAARIPCQFAFTLGVVQTAYANGASTRFLQSHGIQTCLAKTGVKHLHPKAEQFDVGVYFEANGHGTVLFSEKMRHYLTHWERDRDRDRDRDPDHGDTDRDRDRDRVFTAMLRLTACSRVVNQAVGDAVSDMLFALAILQVKGMDALLWHQMYTDLPSRQLKVPVLDKSQIVCNEDETRVISPVALQAALDGVMSSFSLGRCFIRPSGTEDVVRIYAEASSQSEADALAIATIEVIHQHVGVIGAIPTSL